MNALLKTQQINLDKVGLEALKMSDSSSPDLIISDLMMLKIDGNKIFDAIDVNRKEGYIPIIIITTSSASEPKIQNVDMTVNTSVTKPIWKEELNAKLIELNVSKTYQKKKFNQFAYIDKPIELKQANSFLYKVHSIIEENLYNYQFSVNELANQMYMSRMQVHRKLKAVTDRTSSNYIRSYRLHKSKSLLIDLEMSVSEISWEVGFNDVNYYSKSFKKEFGMSPSEYRANLNTN